MEGDALGVGFGVPARCEAGGPRRWVSRGEGPQNALMPKKPRAPGIRRQVCVLGWWRCRESNPGPKMKAETSFTIMVGFNFGRRNKMPAKNSVACLGWFQSKGPPEANRSLGSLHYVYLGQRASPKQTRPRIGGLMGLRHHRGEVEINRACEASTQRFESIGTFVALG